MYHSQWISYGVELVLLYWRERFMFLVAMMGLLIVYQQWNVMTYK